MCGYKAKKRLREALWIRQMFLDFRVGTGADLTGFSECRQTGLWAATELQTVHI